MQSTLRSALAAWPPHSPAHAVLATVMATGGGRDTRSTWEEFDGQLSESVITFSVQVFSLKPQFYLMLS